MSTDDIKEVTKSLGDIVLDASEHHSESTFNGLLVAGLTVHQIRIPLSFPRSSKALRKPL